MNAARQSRKPERSADGPRPQSLRHRPNVRIFQSQTASHALRPGTGRAPKIGIGRQLTRISILSFPFLLFRFRRAKVLSNHLKITRAQVPKRSILSRL